MVGAKETFVKIYAILFMYIPNQTAETVVIFLSSTFLWLNHIIYYCCIISSQ